MMAMTAETVETVETAEMSNFDEFKGKDCVQYLKVFKNDLYL